MTEPVTSWGKPAADPAYAAMYRSAMGILATERRRAKRINAVYRRMEMGTLHAGVADWLGNPYISTALGILSKFTSNYKIQQAVKLLKEAGDEALKEETAKKRKKQKRR